MNFFDTLIIDIVFILFPLIVYNVFLFANKNIDSSDKNIFFCFAVLTSFFLTYRYSDNSFINLLVLNSLVIISYLKRNVILANVVALLIVLLYVVLFNSGYFMIIPYIFLVLLYYFRDKLNIKDFTFVDLFILFQYIILLLWIKIFNNNIILNISTLELFFIMISNYLIIHIIYFLCNEGENIIVYHTNYKELQHDKDIKLSLFKITHEIKNPIAVIKAYLDMMNVNDQKQVNKYIPIIKNEIERLLIILQDFLMVNQKNVQLDIMDINMLLENVIESLNPLFNEKNIKLNQDIIDDEVYIVGDYQRLCQVFINLFKNSVEAMDKENRIINVKNSIKNNKLNIIIEDNGSGISNNNLNKISQPFYTTKNKGTGLGVSLSTEIIKAHGGSIKYDSKEGKGTKVTIQLPLNGKERFN